MIQRLKAGYYRPFPSDIKLSPPTLEPIATDEIVHKQQFICNFTTYKTYINNHLYAFTTYKVYIHNLKGKLSWRWCKFMVSKL